MFEGEKWIAEAGHPATGMHYETAEINEVEGDPYYVPGTWARVTVNGVVVFGPVRNTGAALRAYNRLYIAYVDKMENA